MLDLDALAKVGPDVSRYGQLSYSEKDAEYPRSQDIGEAAHFLDFDGLIVPSARHDCLNVVAFCDAIGPEVIMPKKDHGLIDWTA